jgi:hypothetical protein
MARAARIERDGMLYELADDGEPTPVAQAGYQPRLGIPPDRRAICASNLNLPHGLGHNAVCICGCRWCVEERGAAPQGESTDVQTDLFAGIG